MLSELWSDVRYRLRAVFRRGAVEHEMDDELRYHVDREADKYERLGLTRAEALRRARIAFGGVDRAKEESRDARGLVLLETTLQDLRYALRGLRAKPTFTVGIVLTLGLGMAPTPRCSASSTGCSFARRRICATSSTCTVFT